MPETMVNTEEETSFDIFEENDFQTDTENEDSNNEDNSDKGENKEEVNSAENKEKEAETMLQNLKDSGFDEESIKEQTGRTVEDYIHVELLYEKVLDFLLDNAKIKGTAKSY